MAEVFCSASTAAIPPTEGLYRVAQPFILRAALAHTTSYVATGHMKTADGDFVSLALALVWADSTSTEWYVEWSQDGTTWYRSLNYSASAGVITTVANNATLVNGASANWNDGPIRIQDAYMRVQVKKTGGVGADTIAIYASLFVTKGR